MTRQSETGFRQPQQFYKKIAIWNNEKHNKNNNNKRKQPKRF